MFIVNPEDITDPIDQFITVKDPHANFGFANRIRFTHNEDLQAKFKFLRTWCIDNKVDKIIATGDLTDSNDEKKWSFKQYFLNKQEFQKLRGNEIELFSIAGNHDMFNGMEKTQETVFGELVNEGIVNHFTIKPIEKEFTKPDGTKHTLSIFGIDYSRHKEVIEKQLREINDYQPEIERTKFVVLHSHVTPAEIAATDFTYTQLLGTYDNIDGYICGHYHGGFPTQAFFKKDKEGNDNTSGHVVFINNWSMQRVVRDYYNEMDTHTPEFDHIKFGWSDTYGCVVVSCQTIEIPHKSYAEAFKPKVIDLIKLTRKEHFQFFEKINFDDIPTGSDDTDTINNIATKEKFSPEIVHLAIDYLNNVKEAE